MQERPSDKEIKLMLNERNFCSYPSRNTAMLVESRRRTVRRVGHVSTRDKRPVIQNFDRKSQEKRH